MKLKRHIFWSNLLMVSALTLYAYTGIAEDIEIVKSPKEPDGFEAIRMVVRTNGVYYVSATNVAALMGVANEDVKSMIASGGVSLRNQGRELGYLPDTNGAGLYFYGKEPDSVYTADNIYWLRWFDGKPLDSETGTAPALGGVATSSLYTRHEEQDNFSIIGLVDDIEQDHWIWAGFVSGDPVSGTNSFEIRADNRVDPAGTAYLKTTLFGAYLEGAHPVHHVKISVNDTYVGEGLWTGVAEHDFTVSFPQGLLSEGSNKVTIAAILENGTDESYIRLNSFDLTYERSHTAINKEAMFKPGANPVVTVDGFTNSQIFAVRLSNGDNMDELAATTISSGPAYRASFVSTDADLDYAVFGADLKRAPEDVKAVQVGGLLSMGNRGRYVVITVPELDVAATDLGAYRESKGLTSKVINIEDIYNDFSYGLATPWAIRDFLQYASISWSDPVEYVVLAGEGTEDYKNIGGDDDNLIPPAMVNTPYGLYASDNRLADFDDDGVADVAVGRLPVLTNTELKDVVDKIKRYESAPSGAWQKHVVLVADLSDAGGDFNSSSTKIENLIPADHTTQVISMADHDAATVSNMLHQALNDGAAFINFFGHGSTTYLSKQQVLSNADISSLTNSTRLSILTSMSCSIGQYASPAFDCLGETLVTTEGSGAVAVWAPSGWSMNGSAEILSRGFYKAVFIDGETALGNAMLKAQSDYKLAGKSEYLPYIYNLLGDPATEITGYVAPYKYTYSNWRTDSFTPTEAANGAISDWDADPDGDGLVNLVEYALMLDPKRANWGVRLFNLNLSKPLADPAEPYDMVVTFTRRKGMSGITFLVEASDDLISWTSSPAVIVNTEIVDNGDGETENVNVYVQSPAIDRKRGFVRMRLITN